VSSLARGGLIGLLSRSRQRFSRTQMIGRSKLPAKVKVVG
jgi:hypothetical protein